MSVENAEKFLAEVDRDPELRKKLETDVEVREMLAGKHRAIHQAAKERGFEFDTEHFQEALRKRTGGDDSTHFCCSEAPGV